MIIRDVFPPEDVLAGLQDEIVRAGSMRALAREWGLTVSHLSRCVNGHEAPSPAILARMGLERRVVYVPMLNPAPAHVR